MTTTNPYGAALNTACSILDGAHGKVLRPAIPRRFLIVEQHKTHEGASPVGDTFDTFDDLRAERRINPTAFRLVLAIDLASGQTFTDDELLGHQKYEVTATFSIEAYDEDEALAVARQMLRGEPWRSVTAMGVES